MKKNKKSSLKIELGKRYLFYEDRYHSAIGKYRVYIEAEVLEIHENKFFKIKASHDYEKFWIGCDSPMQPLMELPIQNNQEK